MSASGSRRGRSSLRLLLLVLAVGLVVAACAGPPVGDAAPAATGDASNDAPVEWSGATRNVPGDYPTIQSAVDAADPGDLVLVDRGVYRETVSVSTPGLTIRGVDRNEVIIDGEFERFNGVEVLFADGVVVENMTSMNHTINGFFWTGVRGYRGSYLTAVNNGDYGIYAFDSGDGLFENSYASGSPAAAFYIGQCNPCDAVIRDSVGEFSGLGYSGSNASGPLYIVNNIFRHNGTGAWPNSLDGELLPPTEGMVMAGNLIHDNGYGDFPYKPRQWWFQGNGVALAGSESSTVTKNRIFNHPGAGIWVGTNIDGNVYMPIDNVVSDNVVEGSGLADLNLSGPGGWGNCFENNEAATSMPPLLEFKQPCQGLRLQANWEMGSYSISLGRRIERTLGLDTEVPSSKMPLPGPLPQMPGEAGAPVVPAVDVFAGAEPDLALIEVPAMPADLAVTQDGDFDLMGVTFASTIGGILGVVAFVLPLVLYTVWVAVAIVEIISRSREATRDGVVWIIVVIVVPFVGVISYYLFGKSRIAPAYRWALLSTGAVFVAMYALIGLGVGRVV